MLQVGRKSLPAVVVSGKLADYVRRAFITRDCFICGNSERYVECADQFLKNWHTEKDQSFGGVPSHQLVHELVRRSFTANEVADGFVTDEDIGCISHSIATSMKQIGIPLNT